MSVARPGVVLAVVLGALVACRAPASDRPESRAAHLAACDEAEELLRARGGAATVRDDATSLELLVGDASRPACRVAFAGRAAAGTDLADTLLTRWTAAGWRESPRYAADGVDGQLSGHVRGDALCLVNRSWDVTESPEGPLLRSDSIEVSVLCAARVPTDTAAP